MKKHEKNERDQDAERMAWDSFSKKLGALQTLDEAKLLVGNKPRLDSAGHNYYGNLEFFLDYDFTLPRGLSYAEKALYLKFIQQLGSTGELRQALQKIIEENLHRAIEVQNS